VEEQTVGKISSMTKVLWFEQVLTDFKPESLKRVRDHYRFPIHIFSPVLPEARNTSWTEKSEPMQSVIPTHTHTHFKHICTAVSQLFNISGLRHVGYFKLISLSSFDTDD